MKKVQQSCKMSAGYVYKALYEELELFRKKNLLYPLPKVIGIDEHLFRRYSIGSLAFVTCIVDYKNKRMYEVIEGRDGDSLFDGLAQKQGADSVEKVVIDPSETYLINWLNRNKKLF